MNSNFDILKPLANIERSGLELLMKYAFAAFNRVGALQDQNRLTVLCETKPNETAAKRNQTKLLRNETKRNQTKPLRNETKRNRCETKPDFKRSSTLMIVTNFC